MKISVPKVSIDTDSSDVSGEVTLTSLGFGLHQAWTYSSFFGGLSVFDLEGVSLLHGYTWLYPASCIFFSLALIIIGTGAQKTRGIILTHKASALGVLLMCLGTIIVAIAGILTNTTAVATLTIVGGTLSGIGSAIIFVLWGVSLSLMDEHSMIINVSLSTLIGVVCYGLILQLIPTPFSGFLIAVAPLGELAVLWNVKPCFFAGMETVPVFTPLPIRRGSFALRFCAPVVLFGIALGLIKTSSIIDILHVDSLGDMFFLLIGAVFAFVFCAFVLGSLKSPSANNQVFRVIIPVVSVAAFLIGFANSDTTVDFIDIYIIFAFFCFEIMMWVYFNELSQGYRLSPVYIYGLGRACLGIAGLIASIITVFSDDIVAFIPWGDSGGGFFIMLFLIFAWALLPNRTAIERAALDTCSLTFYYKRDGAPLGSLSKLTENAAATTPSSSSAPSSTAASTAGAANDKTRQAKGTIDDPIPQQEMLQAQCEAIANCYLLSQRETEVFYYLAKGYNSARIQEVLYISEGTAKTHIRHIYRKLNIHSQQDLIRMVDETLEGAGA